MRRVLIMLALLAATPAMRLGAQTPDSAARAEWVRTTSGLEYQIVMAGRGRPV